MSTQINNDSMEVFCKMLTDQSLPKFPGSSSLLVRWSGSGLASWDRMPQSR
jgi:hypothetical protein